MPGYDQFTQDGADVPGRASSSGRCLAAVAAAVAAAAAALGARRRRTAVVWAADGKGVDYSWDGKRFHFDFAKKSAVEVAVSDAPRRCAGGAGGADAVVGARRRGRGPVAAAGGAGSEIEGLQG